MFQTDLIFNAQANVIFQNHNLTFNGHKLTQGWGTPPLDLSIPEQQWIDNYCNLVIQEEQHFNQPLTPTQKLITEANTQHGLLLRAMNIIPGDTIFIPKANNFGYSYDHFIVVTAAGRYQFDNRQNNQVFGHLRCFPMEFYMTEDFGHVIPVNDVLIRTFPYGPQTLQRACFGAPFIAKIVRVPSSSFRGFDNFLRRNNYPFKAY